MLRSIPTTPLVCLVFLLSIVWAGPSWAQTPDESLEVLLKPGKAATAAPVKHKARTGVTRRAPQVNVLAPPPPPLLMPPPGITKVKPQAAPVPCFFGPRCLVNHPQQGQWDISAQVFWARVRGTIAYPRNPWWGFVGWGWTNEADLTDDIGAPKSTVLTQISARYQFRRNWGVRYVGMWDQMSGTGNPSQQFYFGSQWFLITPGWPLNTTWEHGYHRVGLIYDAVRTCSAVVSVFADWVHTDDKINVGCTTCGWWGQTFSEGGDSAMVGLEIKKCFNSLPNFGTFSCDFKGGVIFLDDVEGWDIQVGMRYSIPLNCGRSGYVSGGYKFVDYKKSEQNLIWENTFEGGYLEMGLVF
ncbi:MAG: hypothetical protein AB1664_05050 [Thermodesulfobacteriota bacterium]